MTVPTGSQRSLSVVLTTVGDEATAERIARTLVDEHLAACVNRMSVVSTYRWRDGIEQEPEQLLVIKTSQDLLAPLERRIAELSSYEVPEFVALQPAATSSAYLRWLLEACPAAD